MYIIKRIDTTISDAKEYILNGGIIYTTESDRVVGKSTLIDEIAKERKLPIVVRDNRQAIAREKEQFQEKYQSRKVFSVHEISTIGLFGSRQAFLVDGINQYELSRLQAIYGDKFSGFVQEDNF